MRKFNLSLMLIATQMLFSQNLIHRGEFPPRDFFIHNDALVYIEKRNVIIKDGNFYKSYFVGGYGLEVFDNNEDNEIISVSNEVRQVVSSVRFFNKSTQKVEEVYYHKNGRALDALHLKKEKLMVLSLSDKKIILLDYSKKPTFLISNELKLDSLCRRLYYIDSIIYFGTDSGKIFQYNILTKKLEELFKAEAAITDLQLFDHYLLYSTIEGKVVRKDLIKKSETKIDLNHNFVVTSYLDQNNKVLLGTFGGVILVLNPTSMKIEREISYHKKTILKIIRYNDMLYSSSIDKTLKKWNIQD